MTRKAIALLLTICLVMGLSAPTYAEDTPTEVPEQSQEQPQPQEPQEETPVVVSTLDELQAAIDAAEDGDTIAVSSAIRLKNQSVVTDKNLKITSDADYSGYYFLMEENSQISGFTIIASGVAIIIETNNSGIMVSDCEFIGDDNWYSFLINIFSGTVQIQNCSFCNGKDTAVKIANKAIVTIDECSFTNNTTIMQGAGVSSSGHCYIIDSLFLNNTAGVGGGIYNAGTMEISGCTFSGNKSTDSVGQDIVSLGTLTISDEGSDTEGYYEETTGEQVALPLNASTDAAKLIYLTTEQAAEYFAPETEDEPEATPDPEQPEDEDTDPDVDEPTDPNTPSDTEPSDPESEDGTDDDTPDTIPEEAEDNDGGEDTPTQPEQPTQPDEPSDDDNSGDDTNTPVEPSEPPQEDDDSEDDYSPPVYIRPPHRPSIPVVPDPKPEDPVEPEPTPTLVCGEAAIDVSRSVVLQGYGDGDLHLEDSLTRAQLATIICRLLDDESIAEHSFDNGQHFTDVPADMWCYEYVQIIANAGIVYGVGGGSYDPNGTVTWAQVLTVLSRFVERRDYTLQNMTYDGWALEAVQTAVALGWIEDSAEFDPNMVISRGALVELVNGILEEYR